MVDELDVFLDRVVQFDRAGRDLIGAAPVDDLDVLAARQALGDPTRVHRDVAAADHHDRFGHLRALARVDSSEEADPVDHAVVVLTRDPHRLTPPRAHGEQHRIVTLLQLGQADVATEGGIEMHLETGTALHQTVDVLIDDTGGQSERRDPPNHHAAEPIRHLVDVHRVASGAEIMRGYQSGRAGTDDCHALFPGYRRRLRAVGCPELVHDKALEIANLHRAVAVGAATRRLTGASHTRPQMELNGLVEVIASKAPSKSCCQMRPM